ncbi:MAG: SH3 domain-containing protein [Defluviitaleaceae bacterium]|nr:SH3 domain-containing protein [Defluviitaleaceae bacterium]
MRVKRMLLLLLAMLVFIPGVMVFATRPTPVDQIHAGMFPVGSEQRVEYASALNVRRGPHPRYAAFTHLTRGTVVTVLEYRNKWVRVNTPSGEGWIYAGYLSREMAAAPPLTTGTGTTSGSGTAVVAGSRTPQHLLRADMFPANSTATVDFASHVNIRRGPANSYTAFTHLARGTTVTVLEYRQMWVRLDTASGQGWIFAGFLSNDAVIAARASGSASTTAPTGLGTPTPHAQLRAENFPANSQHTVDYAQFVNVRRGPGTSHAAFTYVSRGTVVTVLEFRQGWVRISTAQGEGWLYAAFLRRP